MTRTEEYNKAMLADNHEWLVRIEKSYDLYGYPPEFVSDALWALDNGQTHEQAIATATPLPNMKSLSVPSDEVTK